MRNGQYHRGKKICTPLDLCRAVVDSAELAGGLSGRLVAFLRRLFACRGQEDDECWRYGPISRVKADSESSGREAGGVDGNVTLKAGEGGGRNVLEVEQQLCALSACARISLRARRTPSAVAASISRVSAARANKLPCSPARSRLEILDR
jgi:hypothetical protein